MAKKQKISPPGRPLVVATVHTEAGWRAARSARTAGGDWLELRLDCLAPRRVLELRDVAALPRPVLLTARHPLEGGVGGLSLARRTALLTPLLPAAAAIDVELRSADAMAAVLQEASRAGAAVVLSHHDFRGTPRLPVLRAKVRAAVAAGADIAKIAITLRTPADLAVLLQLLAMPSAVPMAVMGMGPLGRAARPLLAIAGSILNYGYLDRPQVPGQIAAARLRAVIDELNS